MLKRIAYILILIHVLVLADAQVIADHTVVDQYDQIPQQYMDAVKTMLVDFAGESHSVGYRDGMELLEALDADYQATTYFGTRPAPSSAYVRLGGYGTVGEADFFTSTSAIAAYKRVITDQNETANPYDVMGFGWCWDMERDGSGGTIDPVYNVRWSGSSVGGPDGDREWGLDAGDVSLTGNSVTMDTYLDAVEQYQQLCIDSGYSTKIVFTTGPVDMNGGTEEGFQREIKHDYIRDYVAADETRILFDYADILCWNNDGEYYTSIWDDGGEGREHANIHPDNLEGGYTAHIGNVGALRLGKAMWWMLARIAGWDGNILVAEVQVSSEGDAIQVMTGSELQFSTTVLPEFATNPEVTWSVVNGTGSASISSGGLLRAILPGTVEVVALALDGSGISDTMLLTITPPLVAVTNIIVTTDGGVTEIGVGATLQCSASILPVDATNQAVVWSVVNGTGSATITAGGLLTGVTAGTVEVIATAGDGSMVAGSFQLVITASVVLITNIEITSSGGVTQVETGEELQFSASILPVDATNQDVAWSVVNGTGSATITAGGLLIGMTAGVVDVIAAAGDGSNVDDSFQLNIVQSVVLVTDIEIAASGGATQVISGEYLQITATVMPLDADNTEIAWSVVNGTGSATISSEGLLRGNLPGLVEVVALAQDGSGESSSLALTIIPPLVPVTSIAVTSAGGINEIETGSLLQFSATIMPVDATNVSIAWIVDNVTGSATITSGGLLTANYPGLVNVVALAQDGTGVSNQMALYIEAAQVPVADITVIPSGGEVKIEPGKTIQFSAAISPADASNTAVYWDIVNGTGVAAITAGGWVTGVTEGTVDVVASALDGSGTRGSYVLNVASPDIMVSGISILSDGNINEVYEGNTLQFRVSVLPVEATNPEVIWSVISGTGSAAISSDGLVTALEAGTVTIAASAQDGSGANDEFTLTINGPNGLFDKDEGPPVLLYPNPSGGIFYLDAGDLLIEKIVVVSAEGSVVFELIPGQGEQVIELDLSDQQSGALFIHTITKTQSLVKRAIIIK